MFSESEISSNNKYTRESAQGDNAAARPTDRVLFLNVFFSRQIYCISIVCDACLHCAILVSFSSSPTTCTRTRKLKFDDGSLTARSNRSRSKRETFKIQFSFLAVLFNLTPTPPLPHALHSRLNFVSSFDSLSLSVLVLASDNCHRERT